MSETDTLQHGQGGKKKGSWHTLLKSPMVGNMARIGGTIIEN